MARNSDDEFGGYDPTTPAPPKKAPARAPQTNRAAAGPSSKPANVQSTKASPSKTGKTSAPEDAIILYSDEEDDPPPPKNKGKAAAADPPPVPANGKTTVKRKAKGKGDSVQKDDEDAMEVDDVQTVEPQPAKADARPKPRPIARPQNKTQTRPHHDNSQNEALERENARLRKQLEEVTSHRDKLAKQVQEALQIRQTEPEQKLQECIAQYEATLRAQEQLVEEQTTKLAQYGAVSQSGPAVQFLSREAVDEEKKNLDAKTKQLENAIKEKDSKIAQQERKYRELEQQLDFEMKMHKEYQAKNPPASKVNGGPRAAQTSSSDPLQGEVVKLYEDFTNVLITKVSSASSPYPAWPDLKEYIFNCTYTHVDPSNERGNPSMQFNIRAMWMRKTATDPEDKTPPSSRDELEAKCQYWPLSLELESPEFRERLDFFRESFIFSRDQMNVFMKTLGERLAATQGGEDDDEVEEIISG